MRPRYYSDMHSIGQDIGRYRTGSGGFGAARSIASRNLFFTARVDARRYLAGQAFRRTSYHASRRHRLQPGRRSAASLVGQAARQLTMYGKRSLLLAAIGNRHIAMLGAVLALQAIGFYALPSGRAVPLNRPLASLPAAIGEWTMVRETPMDPGGEPRAAGGRHA